MTPLALTRLLQLTSQALPVGGYSHSFGLESAIETGAVRDEAGLRAWLDDVLEYSLVSYELPMLRDMLAAWRDADGERLAVLNEIHLASRETAELRAATVQMGFSMRSLLEALTDVPPYLRSQLRVLAEPSLPWAWAGAAAAWQIPDEEAATAYLWSWVENQVLVALKSVPLGQSAGQRVLLAIGASIARCATADTHRALHLRSNFAPGLALHCVQHETQYSRLFRS